MNHNFRQRRWPRKICILLILLALIVLGQGGLSVAIPQPALAQGGGPWIQTSRADFSSCSVLTNTSVANVAGGEVRLAAPVEDYFDSGPLNTSRWDLVFPNPGIQPPPVFANGTISVNAAGLRSLASINSTDLPVAVEGRVRFSEPGVGTSFGDYGLGDFNEVSWLQNGDSNALYITDDLGTLFANDYGPNVNSRQRTEITGFDWNQYHDVRMVVSTNQVQYYVDGALQVTHTLAEPLATPLYVWFTTLNSGFDLAADWLRLARYPASGQFVSCPVDTNGTTNWDNLLYQGNLPAGTSVSFETRSSSDAVNWSAWQTLGAGSGIVSPAGRYLQYRATLNTTDQTFSPQIEQVTVNGTTTSLPTSTPTATFTPSPTNTATFTPTPTSPPTNTPTNTPTPTPPVGNFALSFDGSNDLVTAGQVTGTGPLTIEAWVRPTNNNANGLIAVSGDDSWSLELNGGRPTLWVSTNTGWYFNQHQTTLQAGQWYHIAATYQNQAIRTFVNGVAATNSSNTGNLRQDTPLQLGGFSGYAFFSGAVDELRLSNVARYTGNFTVPAAAFNPDANTLLLYHFDTGTGQSVIDVSASANNGVLGTTSAAQNSDPLWVSGYPFPNAGPTPTPTTTPTTPPTNTPGPTPTPTNTPTNTPVPPPTNTPTVTPTPTATPNGTVLTQSSRTDFGQGLSCSTINNASITNMTGGEVRLQASVEDYFDGSSINTSRWFVQTYNGINSPPVLNGGVITFSSDAIVSNYTDDEQTMEVEGRMRFSPPGGNGVSDFGLSDPFQVNVGFNALFIIDNDGTLYANNLRNTQGLERQRTAITGVDPTQYHDFRIAISPSQVDYYIDGNLVVTHSQPTPLVVGPMGFWALQSDPFNDFDVEWMRWNQYPASGTFTSCAFDAGQPVTWSTLSWVGQTPTGTGVSLETRTSDDGVNWSAWSTPSSGTSVGITSPAGRYLQYRLTMSTINSLRSPQIDAVSAIYATGPTPTPTNTPPPTATNTPLPPPPTSTITPLPTATNTPGPTPTFTNTPTSTPTNTPGPTSTPTNTPLPPTATATNTPPPPTPTSTNTPLPTATNTPLPPTATPTNTPLPTNTPTVTPTPSTSSALSFDGSNDVVTAGQIPNPSAFTVEMWIRPDDNFANQVLLVQADDNNGWSVELNGGYLTMWLSTDQGWQPVQYTNLQLQAGQWYHVAATYNSGSARVFVNGAASATANVGTLTQGPAIVLGGLSGYSFFDGTIDELRISNVVRYNGAFTAPTAPFTADGNTLLLWSLDSGSGQTAVDESGNNRNGTLGNSGGSDGSDPTWVTGYSF